ncbi:unnamed protein product [Prorocentrum cordatum]|uniref:Polycystin cation channel PKD1/PKD2 domain-containing protein n=1 Tax=Prorocentrum cordatum TaxID=2364126 RepID=A0ABN9T776_9DINO|nr:unnamed protein product [Polarella glacialis]
MTASGRPGRHSRLLGLQLGQSLVSSLCFYVYVQQDVRSAASSLKHFYKMLFGKELSNTLGNRVKSITTPQGLVSSLEHLHASYFRLPERSLTQYVLSEPSILELGVVWRNRSKSRLLLGAGDRVEARLRGLAGDAGLVEVESIVAKIPVLDHMGGHARAHWPSCYSWDLRPTYEEAGAGELRLLLRWSIRDCLALEAARTAAALPPARRWWLGGAAPLGGFGPPAWMRALLLTQATLGASALLAGRPGRHWRRPRGAALWPQQGQGGRGVQLLIAATSAAQVAAAARCAVPVEGASVQVRLLLLGSACSLSHLCLVPSLTSFDRFHMLQQTLSKGLPRILRFFTEVVPVYLAYTVLGVALWGISDQDGFQSLSHSSVTLFSLMNGDVIKDTFLNLGDVHWMMAQLYLYTFIGLFIYVILNAVLAIMEESFSHTEESRKMSACAAGAEEKAGAPGAPSSSGSISLLEPALPCAAAVASPRAPQGAGTRERLERLQALRAEIAERERECSAICRQLLASQPPEGV